MHSRLRLLTGWPLAVGLVLPVVVTAVALVVALIWSAAAGPATPNSQPAAPPGEAPLAAAPAVTGLLVQVSGAVAKPGLYRVAKGDRLFVAVAAAGGLAPDADPDRLPDMAARLKDGEQVKVPAAKKVGTRAGSGSATVDLNSATLEELEAVPGFSPELAAAAIEYRTQYGGFGSSRELVTVLGMGEADFVVAKKFVRI